MKSISLNWEITKKYTFEDYKQNEQKLNNDRLMEVSWKITSELIPILSSELKSFDANNRVIVTTWSDGRLENLPDSSNLELIIYGENVNPNLRKIVSSLFSVQLKSISWVNIHPSEVEVFDLLKNKLIEDSESSQIFPTRFFDSKFLWGNYEKYEQLWYKFIEDLKNVNSKKIKQFYKKIAHHRKVLDGLVTFRGEDVIYYDDKSKSINLYYESWKDSVFKQWILRVYQYMLARLIFMHIRKNDLTGSDVKDLITMPKTIASKLDYIRDEIKNFDQYEGRVKEIIDTYYYFLNLHNKSKKYYSE